MDYIMFTTDKNKT